jgi:nucleoid-associated protein YgaU
MMGRLSRHDDERDAARGRNGRARSTAGSLEGSWRKHFDLYVVQQDDTLMSIAEKVYGQGDAWNRIQQANPVVLRDPDLLHAGLVLRIPKGAATPLA